MSITNKAAHRSNHAAMNEPGFWKKLPQQVTTHFSLQRWLVMFSLGVFIIALEIYDHRNMHLLHQSGQSLWQDRELIREIVMYGLMAPVLITFLLSFLEKSTRERNRIRSELDIVQAFSSTINDTRQWETLVDAVVRLPGKFTAATVSYLMVHHDESGALDVAGWWQRESSSARQISPDFLISAGRHCVEAMTGQGCATMNCQQCPEDSDSAELSKHCIVLQHADVVSGLLVFYLPAEDELSAHQQAIFDDMAPEIALAIENINLQRSEANQRQAASDERRRIARNLHDMLGQNVSFLRLKLDQLSSDDSPHQIAQIRREIEQMRDVADEAYNQVRETLADLHPDSQRSLTELVQDRVDRTAARVDYPITLQSSGTPRPVPPPTARQIALIVREALNNVEKHAAAQQVTVSLEWAPQRLTVSVADDGVGFDPQAPLSEPHYGLQIMKERAQEMGGHFSILSSIGQGTSVTLQTPLPFREQRADSTTVPLAGLRSNGH